jgi:hypothetical protein
MQKSSMPFAVKTYKLAATPGYLGFLACHCVWVRSPQKHKHPLLWSSIVLTAANNADYQLVFGRDETMRKKSEEGTGGM